MKEKDFILKKRQESVDIPMDAKSTDNLALLVNSPAQSESVLHSLQQAVLFMGLYYNTDKAEFLCFKQNRAIPSLNSKPLK